MWNIIKSVFGFGEDKEVTLAKTRMQADQQDARKRFVFSLLAVNQKADPGYLTKFSETAVSEWYGISNPQELVDRITYYLTDTDSSPGYDAFRAAFLARAGAAVGMLSDHDSWAWAFRACQKVQQTYPSFMHYGMGYLEGHLNYHRDSGADEEQVDIYRQSALRKFQELSTGLWAQTAFNTPV